MQKGQGTILIIMVVLIIAAVAGGAFVYTNYSNKRTETTPYEQITQIPQPASSPVDETADWKTYINNTASYQFNYPSKYFKDITGRDYRGITLYPERQIGIERGALFGLTPSDFFITVVTVDNSKDTITLDDYIKLEQKQDYYYEWKKTEVTMVAGEKAYKLFNINKTLDPNHWIYNEDTVILRGKNIYKITLSAFEENILNNSQQLFNQILSTFKFI